MDGPDPDQRHGLRPGTKFQVSRTLAGSIAYRVEEEDRLLIFDADGTLLAEFIWPKPGTKYVGSGNSRGHHGPRGTRQLLPMS